MKTKNLSHPLRPVTIQYDEAITWTAEDEQLVQAYLKVHQHEWEMQEANRNLVQAFSNARAKMKVVRTELIALTEKLKQFRTEADEAFDKLVLHNFQIEDIFIPMAEKMMKEIKAYQALIEDARNEFDVAHTPFQHYLEQYYDNQVWSEFSTINSKHIQNYAINSIDICLFDKESEKFKGWNSMNKGVQERQVDIINKTIDELNTLQLETTIQYTVWGEILKRFEWARLMQSKEKQFTLLNSN